MANPSDLGVNDDLSTLSWVYEELRRSLDNAHKALNRYLKEVEAAGASDVEAIDPAVLRIARTQLHQSVGALELVGLGVAANPLRAAEAALARLAAKPRLITAAAVRTIEQGSFALLDFLSRRLAGKLVSPLLMFPQYKALQELAAATRVHPADLWSHPWQWHALPVDPTAEAREPDEATLARVESELLWLMRGPAPAAAGRMSALFAGLGATAEGDRATLWKLAAAFFESQHGGLLPSDVYVKRVGSRLLAQLRAGTNAEASDRLAQDLLFFCAQARLGEGKQPGPRLAAVRRTYALPVAAPIDYEVARLGRFDPALIQQARKRVAAAKESWSAVAAGEMSRLPGLSEPFALVGDSLQRLYEGGEPLARALQGAAAQAVQTSQEPSAELAMEVATALLYIDASLEDNDFDHPDIAQRVQRLATRIDDVRNGREPGALERWMEDLYRRVSDRQTMGSVVQELRSSLSEVEKQIDQYFRNPVLREVLIPVPSQLSAMRGVLSVLGMDQASQAVLRMRDDVDELANTEVDPARAAEVGTFNRLADNLGALSFLIDMVSVQPQLAKQLFRFDPASGNLTAVMARAERSGFAELDTVADDAPALVEQAQSLVQAASQPGADAEHLVREFERLSQQARAADQPALAEAASRAHSTLTHAPEAANGQALDAAARQLDASITDFVASQTDPMPLILEPQRPVPPPSPPTAPGETGLEEDEEMREIFLEEAREVVGTARGALLELHERHDDLEAMTTVRRAFHTLKGSSRMIGLNEFGEAGWACEQLYNARLAESSHADADLRGFTAEVLDHFEQWVAAIESRTAQAFRHGPVSQAADVLRLEKRRVPLQTGPAAAPVEAIEPAGLVEAIPAMPADALIEAVEPAVPMLPDDALRSPGSEDIVPATTLDDLQPAAPPTVDSDLPLLDLGLLDEGLPAARSDAQGDGLPQAEPHPAALVPAGADLPLLLDALSDLPPPVAATDSLQARVPDLPAESDLELTMPLPLLDEVTGAATEPAPLLERPDLELTLPETIELAAPADPIESPLTDLLLDLDLDPPPAPMPQDVSAEALALPTAAGVELAEAVEVIEVAEAVEVAELAEPVPVDDRVDPLPTLQLADNPADPAGAAIDAAIDFANDPVADPVADPVITAAAEAPLAVQEVDAGAPLPLLDEAPGILLPEADPVPADPVVVAVVQPLEPSNDSILEREGDGADPWAPLPPAASVAPRAEPVEAQGLADLEPASVIEVEEAADASSTPAAAPADFADVEEIIDLGEPSVVQVPGDQLLSGDLVADSVTADTADAAAEGLVPAATTDVVEPVIDPTAAQPWQSVEISEAGADPAGTIDVVEAAEPAETVVAAEAADRAETVEGAEFVEPVAAPAPTPEDDAEQVKQIGDLRISIPLFNIFLNEADELSRRLSTELAEWAHEQHRPVGDAAVALAHSLAGNSATVGYVELSQLARSLEHALSRSHDRGHGRADEAEVFNLAAEEMRRLLHQFAAGFLRSPDAELLQRVSALEHAPSEASLADDVASAPAEAGDTTMSTLLGDFGQPALMPFTALPEAAARPAAVRRDALDTDEDIDAVDAIDQELFPIFEEEGEELIPQLQSRLREWARRPGEAAAASACMRTLHTLKGGARLAGAMHLGEMAHRLETAIEHLLAGGQPQADDIEPLVGRADAIEARFEALRRGGGIVPPASIHGELDDEPQLPIVVEPLTGPVVETFIDDGGPETAPAPLLPLDDLAFVATPVPAAPLADGAEVADAAGLAPPARSGAAAAPRHIDWSRFDRVRVSDDADIRRAGAGAQSAAVRVRAPLLDRLVNQAGEVSITRARIESDIGQIKGSIGDLSENLERLRTQLRDIELQAESQIATRMEAARAASAEFDPLEMDRFTRFQELTRMMAESVNDVATVQRGLQRTLQSAEDELASQARLTRDLQDDLLRTRMVEFEGLSERLYRVVRQAAKETGKQVRLDIIGGSIEIDRGVLDRMTGSFEHLLRNSVVHGIESPERRQAAGKDGTGAITISVTQEGNEVGVDFRDDGGGLNLARIRDKGLATGLLAADAHPSDAELAALIFHPGFSTADEVTGLAGRGVGMDVVRADVNAMGGRIETATAAGQGTSFKLVLPLTTAVTQVVMLRCADLTVAVPSTLVEIVLRAKPADLERAYQSGHHPVGGQELPFFWLGALLQGTPFGQPAGRTVPLIVIRSAAQRLVLHVDEVVGNQEVVVKNLGPQLSRLPGLTGMTLLPSGQPALIYNPVALATLYGASARAATLAAIDAARREAERIVEAQKPAEAPLVLVVDDSLTVRRVTQRLLSREGYRVTVAKDGLEGLEKLADELPSVVLTDIEMPRMDGFDLVRNMRVDQRLAPLPVIMITSRIAQKHRDYAAELGVNHYLGKPFSEEELLALVANYAGRVAAVPDAGR